MWEILRDNWLLFLIGQYPNGPMGGLVITIALALAGLALAFPLALLVALARIGRYRPLRLVAAGLVHTVRGTPLIMVVFWAYFLLPVLIGHTISGFATMVGAIVIYESAYIGEVIRAGIEAIPRGQEEAAKALGLSYVRTMALVILPQALLDMLPSLISQFVSIIKETSLGYTISVNEMTFAAAQVNSVLLTKPVQVFSILALTYFVLCFLLTQTARFVDRRIALRRAGVMRPRREVAPARLDAAVMPVRGEAAP
jgi:polar amino acid transport system permease protein